jgi:tRNA(Ile)-lysidine synthase
MFDPSDRVLLAVSGGPDSVALAHLMLRISPEYSLSLGIAHLNHGLRAQDAENDAAFVTSLAGQLGLPFHADRRDVIAFQRHHQLSLEEAARKVRYQFLFAVAEKFGFNKIALGHHADDNAELVLMYLLRGSGPSGLSGIPPVRGNKIVRPLICLERSEIMAYISEKNLPYMADRSNEDPRFLRNRIRQHLIPELKTSYNPSIVATLNRLAMIFRTEDQWFEENLALAYKNCISINESSQVCLSLAFLNQLAAAVKRRVIRKAIGAVQKNLRNIALAHVEAVLGLSASTAIDGRVDLPDGIHVFKNREELIIYRNTIGSSVGYSAFVLSDSLDYHYEVSTTGLVVIREANMSIALAEIPVDEFPGPDHADRQIAFFDMEQLSFPLVVRNFRPGDRFSPLGMCGRQKVKKFFINNKVPRWQRQKCPILLSRDKIIWIAGHRIDDSVKVRPQTRRILKAELFLA